MYSSLKLFSREYFSMSNKYCNFATDMKKKDNTPKTREQIFAEKADNYGICYSTICPLREHCLHSLLTSYKPKDRLYTNCVNLNNPQMQREGCPLFSKDEPIRMPVGLSTVYYDMPGRMERAIKNHLPSSLFFIGDGSILP